MTQVYLFQLASRRTEYLSERQSLIASNIANASTPGFAARDLAPFSAVLAQTEGGMTTTNPAHITPTATELDSARAEEKDAANASLSGNSVNLESEMINLGDVSRDYSEATSIKRAFHQMMMQAIK